MTDGRGKKKKLTKLRDPNEGRTPGPTRPPSARSSIREDSLETSVAGGRFAEDLVVDSSFSTPARPFVSVNSEEESAFGLRSHAEGPASERKDGRRSLGSGGERRKPPAPAPFGSTGGQQPKRTNGGVGTARRLRNSQRPNEFALSKAANRRCSRRLTTRTVTLLIEVLFVSRTHSFA